MRWFSIFTVLGMLVTSTACTPDKGAPGRCAVTIRGQQWQVETAITAEERRKGLMYRESLAPRTGMVFLMPEPQVIGIWMKNTKVSLDILFISPEGKIAYIHRNAVPESTDAIQPEGAMAAVLEISAGEAKGAKLRVGDTVAMPECQSRL